MRLMTFYGNTDMGQLRTNNEDDFIAQNIWDKKHILAVVIDGVGGYDGGEVASGLAKKYIVEYLENYSNGERLELLKQAVISANNAIFAEHRNQRQYSSMSCVLTAILIEVAEKRINMAHVGDTRLYQFADGRLVKLSHDHSLVGYREEIGELTEEEAMRHPQRNIIGRDIGSRYLENGSTDYVETATFPLLPHAALLLCSDGLCDMLTSIQMTEILRQSLSVEKKVNALIAAANNAGGKDNVTVVLVESNFDKSVPKAETGIVGYKGSKDSEEDKKQVKITQSEVEEVKISHSKKKLKYLIWIITIVVALAAGFFMGRFFERNTPRDFSSPSTENCEAISGGSVSAQPKTNTDTDKGQSNPADTNTEDTASSLDNAKEEAKNNVKGKND